MSKSKLFRDRETNGQCWYAVNSLDDIFDQKRFTSENLKELTGEKTERKARKKAKAIFMDFLEMVKEDMVHDNDFFVFPRRDFGYMAVTSLPWMEDKPNYKFDINTNGKVYGLMIKLNEKVLRANGGKFYNGRFTRPTRNLMRSLITEGHKWTDLIPQKRTN